MLVRPEGRTLLFKFIELTDFIIRFNARPPRRTDATRSQRLKHHGANHSVSMLVRPEGRTLQHAKIQDHAINIGFNARPPRRTDATGVGDPRV